jgi:hypothetical protein
MDKQLTLIIKIGIAAVLAFLLVKIIQTTFFCGPKRNEPFSDYPSPGPMMQMLKKPFAEGADNGNDMYKPDSYRINVPEKGRDASVTPMPTGPKRMAMGVATDLLPKEDKWAPDAESFEAIMPKAIKDQNFLEADRFIGVDTISTSNKNANLQLRADPAIPKVDVGPFLNSSYDKKDDLRKPLDC